LSLPNRLVRRLKRGAYFSEPRFAVKRFFEVFVVDRSQKKTQTRLSARRLLLRFPEENQAIIFTSATCFDAPLKAFSSSAEAYSTDLIDGVNSFLKINRAAPNKRTLANPQKKRKAPMGAFLYY